MTHSTNINPKNTPIYIERERGVSALCADYLLQSHFHAYIGKVVGYGNPSTASANYYHNVSVSGWGR